MMIQLLKVAKFYRHLHGGGHELAHHHTNVCKFSQRCGAISSLVKDVLLSNLAILLKLGALFNGFSLTGPYKKLKKLWKGLLRLYYPIGQSGVGRDVIVPSSFPEF